MIFRLIKHTLCWEGYLQKILNLTQFYSRIGSKIFIVSTYIFCKYSSQTWYNSSLFHMYIIQIIMIFFIIIYILLVSIWHNQYYNWPLFLFSLDLDETSSLSVLSLLHVLLVIFLPVKKNQIMTFFIDYYDQIITNMSLMLKFSWLFFFHHS